MINITQYETRKPPKEGAYNQNGNDWSYKIRMKEIAVGSRDYEENKYRLQLNIDLKISR